MKGKTDHLVRNLLLVVAVTLVLAVATVIVIYSTPSPGVVSTTSTYYSTSANAILSAVVQTNPSGFTLESSKGGALTGAGTQTGDWAVLGQQDGSIANLTVMVYPTVNASQSYFNGLVTNLKYLPGYTEINSTLSSYRQYGKCYGYGEDVDGIAIANGICTKGNVVLQVHLASSIALNDLEVHLTSLMGALYQGTE